MPEGGPDVRRAAVLEAVAAAAVLWIVAVVLYMVFRYRPAG